MQQATNARELLAQMNRLGVELWADRDMLRYRAPKKLLTDELRAQLQRHKADLLSLLGTPAVELAAKEFPLSYGQQALWFLHQLAPSSGGYNTSLSVLLGPPLDVAALQRALGQLVARHGSLRLRFSVHDGVPLQQVADVTAVQLQLIDATTWPEPELHARVRAEAQRPFALQDGEAVRLRLYLRPRGQALLLLSTHHILIDGASCSLLLQDLGALYALLLPGRADPLPAPGVGYQEFVRRQDALLRGPRGAARRRYWLTELAGALPTLRLPTDHPRPAVLPLRSLSHRFALDAELARALRALARAEGVTLYALLLAAFQVLLHRYSHQDEVLIGSPVNRRSEPRFQRTVGYFVNTVVLRSRCDDHPSFRVFLRRTFEKVLGALEHADYPLPLLIEALRPQRDLRRAPLFQAMFTWIPLPAPELAGVLLPQPGEPPEPLPIGGLQVTPYDIDVANTEFDLELSAADAGERILCELSCNVALCSAASVTRMASHLPTLLKGIVADPDQKLHALPLLTEAERHQVLCQWNETQTEYPHDKCIHTLFEAQVERTPESVAVVFADQRLTYRELNACANQLARHLRGQGVGPEGLVGLCVQRSLEMVIGLLGILKAGGAYVPLDPEYPSERLAFILQDAQPRAILVQRQLLGRLPEGSPAPVLLDDSASLATASTENMPNQARPHHLAYVLYTSGSTGRPKGCAIAHRGACNLVHAQAAAFGIDAKSRVVQFASLNFDASVFEILMALCHGGSLHIAGPEAVRDPDALMQWMKKEVITVATLPPALLPALSPVHLCSVSTLILAGEACLPAVAARWLEGRRVFNAYGPTEATVWATVAQCGKDLLPPVIGRPIANTQIYILDGQLEPVPIGVPGEIHIGGVGLARGYLNRPELTAQKFIPNPFSPDATARLYKSGDLARFLPDGNIEFLGRLDDQVKLRGVRIELAEITAALCQHPWVRAAVVQAREDAAGDKRLVAYLQAADSSQDEADLLASVRSFLKQKLPAYMVPAHYVRLDALPLTPNGKVDQRALPAPLKSRHADAADYRAPRDAIEAELARIWAAVLRLDRVGVQDNFFDLGGHSLMAAQLVTRIREAFKTELPLRALFEHPTIESLARALAARKAGERRVPPAPLPSPLLPLRSGDLQRPLFLLHPIGGHVFCYAELARSLQTRQAVYGVEASCAAPAQTSIEDMARAYLAAVRAVQPHGPYRLGGWSLGGLLAFEMARQLVAHGQPLALLALLDSWAPRLLSPVDAQTDAPPQTELPELRRLYQRHLDAWVRYTPGRFPGPGRITLLRASASAAADETLGWAAHCEQPVTVHIVSADHYSLLQHPAVQELARLLSGYLV